MTANKTIDVQCGIYSTYYCLIEHRDGSISVDAPYVSWKRDTGTLARKRHAIAEEDKGDMMAFFEQDELILPANNNCGALSLEDILEGHRAHGVHVITDD